MYAEQGLFEDYQNQVDEVFKNDPLSQFVKCLRQYCLHYEAPAIGFSVEVTPSDGKNEHLENISINLFVEELRKYDNWNKLAKQFLEESGEDINVVTIVQEYRLKVERFYNWFFERIDQIHAEELQRLDEKKRELFVASLRDQILICKKNPDRMGFDYRNFFDSFLEPSQLDQLYQIPIDSPAFPIQAIYLLETRYKIPDSLKTEIEELFTLPNFINPSSP